MRFSKASHDALLPLGRIATSIEDFEGAGNILLVQNKNAAPG
jgi:hypothetical protein